MKFSELAFVAHPNMLGGVQARKDFKNGFGISVIRAFFSYGGRDGLYELAVIKDEKLHYDNSVAAGDVRGHLTTEEVETLGTEVENFEPTTDQNRNRE